jgi:deazaflavin-dependent oxidoreductase (nitroreductase family)
MTTPRWLLRILWLEDRALSRVTGGRMVLPNASGGAVRTLFLRTMGRKSGQARRTGLYYVEEGPNLAIVASNAGRDQPPAWWLNLRAHPDTEVEVGSEVRAVHARQATPEETERIYAMFVAALPQYGDYQKRTTRDIPVVILEPR